MTLYKYIFFDKFDNEDSKLDIDLAFGFHFYTKFQDGHHPIVKKGKNSKIPLQYNSNSEQKLVSIKSASWKR